MSVMRVVAIIFLASWAGLGWSHELGHTSAAPAEWEQQEWGIAGDPADATRTVRVRMLDSMRFVPDSINVVLGETVRFVVSNEGNMLHELVLGTREENVKHAALMARFPGMEHDEAHMVHVVPGESAEMIWHFNRAGVFEYACLLPGHYEAGMHGVLKVTGP